MLLWGLRRQRNITTLLMLGHRADQTIPQPGMSVSKVGRGSHATGLPESLVGSLSCSLCLFIPSALLGTAKLCKLAHNRIQWAAGLGLDPKTIHRRMFTCNIYCSGPMEALTMSQVHIQSDKVETWKLKHGFSGLAVCHELSRGPPWQQGRWTAGVSDCPRVGM